MNKTEIILYAEMALNAICTDEVEHDYILDSCIQHPLEPSYYIVSGLCPSEYGDCYVSVIVADGNPMTAWTLNDWQLGYPIKTWQDVEEHQDEFIDMRYMKPVWMNGLPRVFA